MPEFCPECGASVPNGGTCRDNFDALLILEWRIPGGCGHEAHFLAVSTYILQHPDSMHHRADAYERLRQSVSDLLDGKATLAEIRARTRRAADGPPAPRAAPATSPRCNAFRAGPSPSLMSSLPNPPPTPILRRSSDGRVPSSKPSILKKLTYDEESLVIFRNMK